MSFGHKDPQEFDDSLDHHTIQQDIQGITLPNPPTPPLQAEIEDKFGLNL
jgi:hypothetical protein